MIKLTDKVIRVLEESPETRNSDRLLLIRFWKKYHSSYIKRAKDGIDYVMLKSIVDLPSEQDLGRVRRKIQSPSREWPLGRYLPTSSEVRRRRGIEEMAWRAWNNVEFSMPQLKI